MHESNLFLTLTYDDDNLPRDERGKPTFDKGHIQRFFKRLRKKYTFRYFLVSEYGSNSKRPHYHAILFGLPLTDEIVTDITRQWTYGFVKVDPANDRRLNYCCKYILFKSDAPEGSMKPFLMCSKIPPLGVNFFFRSALLTSIALLRGMISDIKLMEKVLRYRDCCEIDCSLMRINSCTYSVFMEVLNLLSDQSLMNSLKRQNLPIMSPVNQLLEMLANLQSRVELLSARREIAFKIDNNIIFYNNGLI